MQERVALESEIIRKCMSRSELQCSFVQYRGYKVIYRRYASLFFIVGTKADVDVRKIMASSKSQQPDASSGVGGKQGRYDKSYVENHENELGLLEFIHCLVETMDRWAGSICELDIMYQLEQVSNGISVPFWFDLSSILVSTRFAPNWSLLQVHFLLDEMVMNGYVVETNKSNILRPIDLMDRESKKNEGMFRWWPEEVDRAPFG